MSGPIYPYAPVPSSNAIGSFTIGVSPIGTIIPFNFWDTILSQYANSPVLTKLIGDFDEYVDQTQNLDAFYDLIWNVDTAQGYGLDVWGRIVGVTRVLSVPTSTYLGFDEQGSTVGTFGQSPFFMGEPSTGNYLLSDSAFRILIFAKALANISDGSTPSINQILLNLFPGRGNCYVTDQNPVGGPFFGFEESGDSQTFGQATFYGADETPNMTIFYVFDFLLTPVEFAIVEQSGVLPKPVGVAASVVQITI